MARTIECRDLVWLRHLAIRTDAFRQLVRSKSDNGHPRRPISPAGAGSSGRTMRCDQRLSPQHLLCVSTVGQ
ncbi:hypothetical protein SSAG_04403 [Streptomyces sp. Mg1]|nr:hypothetical protein SSAG_04403 [Streptomyces sp. Mg1]